MGIAAPDCAGLDFFEIDASLRDLLHLGSDSDSDASALDALLDDASVMLARAQALVA
jgi:hypothetical protein